MSIDKLRQPNSLKSLTGNKLLSADIANILSDNRWQTETRHRTTLSGAAMIFASVCLLELTANKMITKPFALSLSKCECGSTSSPRTLSFYCALAIVGWRRLKQTFVPKKTSRSTRSVPSTRPEPSSTRSAPSTSSLLIRLKQTISPKKSSRFKKADVRKSETEEVIGKRYR